MFISASYSLFTFYVLRHKRVVEKSGIEMPVHREWNRNKRQTVWKKWAQSDNKKDIPSKNKQAR